MALTTITVRKLAELAHTAPSADNSQPWRLSWDGETLAIAYDTERVSGKTFPADSPATLLSIGAVVENIITVATDWDLQPQLEYREKLPSTEGEYARIHFLGSDQDNAKIGTDHCVSRRHCNRRKYTKTPVPITVSKALITLREGASRTLFIEEKSVIQRIASMVQLASEIRFQTREVHEWLGKSLRFSSRTANRGDGMDIATLALPPGGGLFLRLVSDWHRMRILNRLGIYKVLSAIDSAPIKSAPGLIAVIGGTDALETINAGRVMGRTWTLMNSQGLSMHPYYVIPDQLARYRDGTIPSNLIASARSILQGCKRDFKLQKGETLHMIFRAGYSTKSPVYSQRLPLGAVYLEELN
jgi:hypothetical protein